MNTTPLERAIQCAGSQSSLADAVVNANPRSRIKQQHISYWLKSGRVPAEHCAALEAAVGGQVTRHELRPDVFGEKASAA